MKDKLSDLKFAPIRESLSICFEEEGFSFAIIKNESIVFANTYFFKNFDINTQLEETVLYFEKEKKLNQDFDKVILSFVNSKQILVPAEFYSEEKEEEFLQFGLSVSKNNIIERNYIKNYDNYLIFTYKEAFEEFLKKKYSKILLLHSASGFLFSRKAHLGRMEIHLMIYMGKIDLVFLRNKKLLFYNSFDYQTKEDILYYIAFIADYFSVKGEHLFLILEGKVRYQDLLYNFLADYFENIEVRNLTTKKKINSYGQFAFLLNLFQCASFQEN